MNQLAPSTPPEAFGRYLLYPAIARGGMATVHPARLVGAEGFTRLVAAKRLHPQFTDDPDFVTMFHDEACIASRIHHPNVVPVLDIVVAGNELILVQEYVHGVPLSQLMKIAQLSSEPIDADIAVAVLTGVLSGLHAAHEVRDELDRPLEIVHRDVSPANVMISVDGIPRLLDFGIAKARTSTHHTREGVFKGKLAYMAPEQLRMENIDRTADIYAVGVLAWELLVNRRVYDNRHELAFVTAVMNAELPSITAALEETRESFDDDRWQEIVALEPIITRAMSPRSEERFATALEMLHAILEVRPSATSIAVTEWVRDAGADFLDQRQRTLAANEESWRRSSLYTPTPMSGTQRAVERADRTSAPGAPPPTPPSSFPSTFPCASPSSLSGSFASPFASPYASPFATSPSTPLSSPLSSAPPTAWHDRRSSSPPASSGSYRVTLGAPHLARIGAELRASRFLPWIAGAALVLAALAGGLLRGWSGAGAADSAANELALTPGGASNGASPGAASAAGPSLAIAIVPPAVVPAASAAAATALPASSEAAAAAAGAGSATTAATAAGATSGGAPATSAPPSPVPTPAGQASIPWRPNHPAPPPPPPRWVPPPRPTPLPPPTSASAPTSSASAQAKADCNPPFYFDGTKKIFKPSCL